MMLGGGLMLGMGLLVMILVFGLPILLVLVFGGGMAGFFQKQGHPNSHTPFYSSMGQTVQPISKSASYCAHCGVALQADWTHCPQCGAPIG